MIKSIAIALVLASTLMLGACGSVPGDRALPNSTTADNDHQR